MSNNNASSKGGIDIEGLTGTIQKAENNVVDSLESMRKKSESKIDVGELFKMQWMMNKFAQLSEMVSAVVSGANQAIQAITRNIK